MPFIDRRLCSSLAGLSLVAGCSAPAPPAPSPPSRAPSAHSGSSTSPAVGTAPVPTPAPAGLATTRLAAPGPVRNWAQVREQAAQRIVAANPAITYLGAVPEPLLAIPVLEIELNGDGSIRKIDVLRQPGQARDTVQIATDAVRRAAPFGDVSRLPRPWRFAETFLFDNERKFKPRTLDR